MKKYILLASFIIFIFILFFGFKIFKFKYAYVIKINWNINLPHNYTEIYNKDSGSSPHGDGIRYHVFEYDDINVLKENFLWSDSQESTRYFINYKEAITNWLDEILIPKDKRMDFAVCKFCYFIKEDNSEAIFILNEDIKTLYVVENFI